MFTSQSFSKPHPATESNIYFLDQITFLLYFYFDRFYKKKWKKKCCNYIGGKVTKTLQCFLQIHICQSNKT